MESNNRYALNVEIVYFNLTNFGMIHGQNSIHTPSCNEIINLIKNIFKDVSPEKMTAMDIYACMCLKYPSKYTNDQMILDTLINNKNIFEMETVPGQQPTWSLKRHRSMSWKQMIASALKGNALTCSEIEDRVQVDGRRSTGKVNRTRYIHECLKQNSCFKRVGNAWIIREKD